MNNHDNYNRDDEKASKDRIRQRILFLLVLLLMFFLLYLATGYAGKALDSVIHNLWH